VNRPAKPDIEVELVSEPDASGLFGILDRFLTAIGEAALDDRSSARLGKAMGEDKIFFYIARIEGSAVGVCSLTVGFSTYRASPFGVIDDFYIVPEMRKKGVARVIVEHVLSDAGQRGCRSVIIGCGNEEVAMYRHLGFKTIGNMMAIDLVD